MGLLFAAAVVLLIAALVLRSAHPKRALAVAIAGVLGALAGLLLFLTDHDRHAGPAAIAPAELALSDVVLTQDRYGPQLSGHLRNGSARRLGTLMLTVTYKSCTPDGACKILGEESPRLFLALPPGQTSGFSTLLTKAALMEQPGVAWDCTIASAQSDF